MNDKRNPSYERGVGETLGSYADRINEVVRKLEWQSEGHRMWYTHKNPYGCWICELLQVCGVLLDNHLSEGRNSARDVEEDIN